MMEEILKNIKDIRMRQGLTQLDVAARLNLEESSYYLVEAGKTTLTVKRLYDIAEILNVSVFDILPGSKESELKNQTILEGRFRIMMVE
jgi:transcriptional regulator with XRE-family HTH domain